MAVRPGPVIVIALLVVGAATAGFGIWWHAFGPGATVREQLRLRQSDPLLPPTHPSEAPLTRQWSPE
ncbi:MAG: hypothetical protein R3B96_04225 [Pirellulaceae bacterium]|nr:hypothetical protein [Planctomycetales bacterium]